MLSTFAFKISSSHYSLAFMFAKTAAFNHDIGGWNLTSVTNTVWWCDSKAFESRVET